MSAMVWCDSGFLLVWAREMLGCRGVSERCALRLACSSVTCYTLRSDLQSLSIRGDVARDGHFTSVSREVRAVCRCIMLKLFLHGAVPFGFLAPMGDEDAGYGDRGHVAAEVERPRHLPRGKSPSTCYAVYHYQQVRVMDAFAAAST